MSDRSSQNPGIDEPTAGRESVSAGVGMESPAPPITGAPGAALAEEHSAPPPSARLGPKLWIVAGLAVIVAVIAIANA